MGARFPVPIQEDVRDLLFGLLNRGVAVDRTEAFVPGDDGAVAEFVTEDGGVGAVCLMDQRFVVRAGAALVLVPPTSAEDDLRRGELDQHVEVTGEVVNVMGRLLNSPSTPHLKLAGLHRLPGDLPDEVQALVDAPAFRRDFAVTIDGYGDARLSLLVG